jgi:hypothetical protein
MFLYINEPWVFVKNDIKNPVRYTVYFHINSDNAPEVKQNLIDRNVKYIVLEDKRGIPKELDEFIAQNYTPIDSIDTLEGAERDDPLLGRFSLWAKKIELRANAF